MKGRRASVILGVVLVLTVIPLESVSASTGPYTYPSWIDYGRARSYGCVSGTAGAWSGTNADGDSYNCAHFHGGIDFSLTWDAVVATRGGVQWHLIGSLTAQPQVQYGRTSFRTIQGWYSPVQVVGDYTCKYGRITGYDCGYIDNDGFCATWVPNWTCTYMMLRNNAVDMSSPGDSGGPIFFSDKGRGITSGATWNIAQSCECNNVYTPIEYVQGGLGVVPFHN